MREYCPTFYMAGPILTDLR